MRSDQPLYFKIKEDFLNKIRNQQLKPGDRLPTEQQLMEEYQVSRITVSKALNELKKAGVLVRFPHRGTFVADSGRPSPEESEDFPVLPALPAPEKPLTEVALLLPSIPDLFSISLINGVLSALPSDQYICHIFRTDTPDKENLLLRYCMEKEIAGIVLFPQNHIYFDDSLLTMHLKRYPMVLVDRCLPYLDTNYAIPDHYLAGTLCVRHLYELGHRHFAFVTICSDLETSSVKRRYEGIRDEARTLGLPEQAVHLVLNVDSEQAKESYRELFLNLIIQHRVTAFIASECNLCSYLFDLFDSMGYHVPDKLSLMTFDKSVHSSRHYDFFTHIDQSEYRIGHEAGLLLKNRIERQDMSVYHRIIPPVLSVHASTQPVILS